MLNRRTILGMLAASVTFLGGAALTGKADDKKKSDDKKSADKLPPGHPPVEHIGYVNVTPDMHVTITGEANGVHYFHGKARDFRLTIRPKATVHKSKVRAKANLPVFTVANLAKLPHGEFEFDGKPLSDPNSFYEVFLEIDEIHLPGVSDAEIAKYHGILRQGIETGVGPGLIIQVDNGAWIKLENIRGFNTPSMMMNPDGEKWAGTYVVAKTAARVE